MAVNNLITFRKGTSSEWTFADPVLSNGEPGYDTTNKLFKIGNGSLTWSQLKPVIGGTVEYDTVANFPNPGINSILYIATDSSRIYRWTNSVYVEMGPLSQFYFAWTPYTLGNNLSLWLDANDTDTIILNGSSVSQWNDKSGNNLNATQATATNQPIYSQTGWQNNKPAITFSSIDGRHMNFSGFASGTYDLFSVFKHDGATATTFGFWRNAASNTFLPLATNTSGTGTRLVGVTADNIVFGYPNGRSTAISVPADGASFRQAYWSICTVADGLFLRLANVPISATSDINRIGFSTISYGIQGQVCEIIAISSSTTNMNKQKLEGYLAWKWGLVDKLPSNHLYKNGPP